MMSKDLPGKERVNNISGKAESMWVVLEMRECGTGRNMEHRTREDKW